MTSAPVLLFKMRCVFFSAVKTCLCALSETDTALKPYLSQEEVLVPSSLSASPFLWRPLIFCKPCLVRLSLISFLNGINFMVEPCHFISDIIDYFLASNKLISLTTRLAVKPNL